MVKKPYHTVTKPYDIAISHGEKVISHSNKAISHCDITISHGNKTILHGDKAISHGHVVLYIHTKIQTKVYEVKKVLLITAPLGLTYAMLCIHNWGKHIKRCILCKIKMV